MSEHILCGSLYPGSKRPGDRIVRCDLSTDHLDGPAPQDHEETETGATWPVVPEILIGSAEHAAAHTEGRHPGVRDALQWLTFAHLPAALQRFSRPLYMTGIELVTTIKTDCPELTTSLNKLVEAKDSAVRAGIRHDTGRAGSVPRPQNVVMPPALTINVGPGQLI